MKSKITAEDRAQDWLTKIGDAITRARSERRLSENALSKRAGVSRSHVRGIEAGKNSSLLLIAKLLDALDLPATVAGVSFSDVEGHASPDIEALLTDIGQRLYQVQQLVQKQRGK